LLVSYQTVRNFNTDPYPTITNVAKTKVKLDWKSACIVVNFLTGAALDRYQGAEDYVVDGIDNAIDGGVDNVNGFVDSGFVYLEKNTNLENDIPFYDTFKFCAKKTVGECEGIIDGTVGMSQVQKVGVNSLSVFA